MNKTDLIRRVAKQNDTTNERAAELIASIFDPEKGIIAQGLREDGQVMLAGFGSWKRTERSARTGVNPKTKERLQIPSRTTIKFTTGSVMKDAFNPKA